MSLYVTKRISVDARNCHPKVPRVNISSVNLNPSSLRFRSSMSREPFIFLHEKKNTYYPLSIPSTGQFPSMILVSCNNAIASSSVCLLKKMRILNFAGFCASIRFGHSFVLLLGIISKSKRYRFSMTERVAEH